MLSLSKNHNPNYLAKVVRISNVRKHGNADKLQCTTIDGNNVIIGLDNKIGDLGVFFPLECQIDHLFISANNLFKDKEHNLDKEKSGFFEDNRRVKALKLRGEKSMGFWVPASYFSIFEITEEKLAEFLGMEFDTIHELLLVKKYEIYRKGPSAPGEKKDKKAAKADSILVENQFRFHIDTPMLFKNIWKFNPDTHITITQKLHGTSFISSNVLIKRRLSWFEKMVRFLGARIQETEYGNLYASRRVIKNIKKNAGSFYNQDIWGMANDRISVFLEDGMTVYGEIVGFLPNGNHIQKGYDYFCEPGEYDIYIYRITWTLPSGAVIEWTWDQVKQWCMAYGFMHVPEFYYGKASDLFVAKDERSWSEDFSKFLETSFLEYSSTDAPLGLRKNAALCSNKVPDEGIVVRNNNSPYFDVYKLKSFAFYHHETKQLDSGEVDLESEQSQEEEAA